MPPPDEADWAGLPEELLALCFCSLGQVVHLEGAEGWLTPTTAAQLLASCSACRSWRAVALYELRCRVRAETAVELEQLATAAPPCSALCLPAALPPRDRSNPAAWDAQRRRQAALHHLLHSAAFWRSSAGCLREVRNCPLGMAQSGALAGYPMLHTLTLSQGLCIGHPAPLRGSSLPGVAPSLRRLELELPAGGTLDALRWPPCLESFVVIGPRGSGADATNGQPGLPAIRLQPCSCVKCGPFGFWNTLGSLHVVAARVTVHLDACHALRSCRSLRIVAGGGGGPAPAGTAAAAEQAQAAAGAEGAGEPPEAADLQPWLAGLAPLFAATALRHVEVAAGAACLDNGVAGAHAVVLRAAVASLVPPAAGARLAAAALPAGLRQSEANRVLHAELWRSCGSASFRLCIAKAD
ncbi:hypothetical protein ABPG75_000460 [Micractinium tetrahymenae]